MNCGQGRVKRNAGIILAFVDHATQLVKLQRVHACCNDAQGCSKLASTLLVKRWTKTFCVVTLQCDHNNLFIAERGLELLSRLKLLQCSVDAVCKPCSLHSTGMEWAFLLFLLPNNVNTRSLTNTLIFYRFSLYPLDFWFPGLSAFFNYYLGLNLTKTNRC